MSGKPIDFQAVTPRSMPVEAPADLVQQLMVLEQTLHAERNAWRIAQARLQANNRALSYAGLAALESQRRTERALWATGEAIWDWDSATNSITIQAFHQQSADLTNLLPSRLHFDQYLAWVVPEDQETFRLSWNLMMKGSRPDFDLEHRLAIDHQVHWARVRGRATLSSITGQTIRVIGTIKDVTIQRQNDQSLRLMAHAFTSSPDAMVVTNAAWHIVEANGSFYDLVKIQPSHGMHMMLSDFMDVETLLEGIDPELRLWHQEASLVDFNGLPIPVEATVSVLSPVGNRHLCHVVALRDISERKRAAARLEWFAHYDPLTELMNRTAIKEHLDRQLAASPDEPFALLFIDLDGFKEVNDSLGHNNGDTLLKEVAQRLQEVLAHRAIVARWGGDEFVVMLHAPSATPEALDVTQRLVVRLSEPIMVAEHAVTITPSIGVALAPRDGRDASTLLRRADSAMYAAKDAGRNRCEFYRSDLDADLLQRMQLTSLLRVAVDRNDFQFVAQPKTTRHGDIVGAELLVRWHSDALGIIPPSIFIPLAEEIGVINQIGRLALDRAAEFAAQVRAARLPWTVAVNLSSLQVADPDLEPQLMAACHRHHVDPSQLELEVTESAFIGNVAAARGVLGRLHELGFCLALDDFGTGYSALSYLRELPFDKIKIDRSFIRDIDTDPKAHALVEGMVALCDTLGMRTVAEGVETDEQRERLASMYVDEFQGYLFAHPMALTDLLKIQTPLPHPPQ